MVSPTIVITEEIPLRNRLRELGLSTAVLRGALEAGFAARSSCTPHDPPILMGMLFWGRTLRALRDALCPEGWHRSDVDNFSTVVSPDGSYQISVATGDEGTGMAHLDLRTKYPKGPATAAAVAVNADQLELWPDDAAQLDIAPPPPDGSRLTYLLLVRVVADEIRSELSLPNGIGEGDRVESWVTRLILPSVRLDGPFDPTGSPSGTGDVGDEIVVPVRRRA